jgi:hypothetical protein
MKEEQENNTKFGMNNVGGEDNWEKDNADFRHDLDLDRAE